MSGASYNGYPWKQRAGILRAYHRGDAGPDFTLDGKPCGLCGDPDRAPNEWHSEDYSEPYSFEPPQSYPVCKSCHSRLHKRFQRPSEEWDLFCRHVEAGGYGREFVILYPTTKRAELCARIADGQLVEIAPIRSQFAEQTWWRDLTLDPESLEAPWARPRPLRARPDEAAYRYAIEQAKLSEIERAILSYHANAYRRTVTMRNIATEVLGKSNSSAANLAYGGLARRIAMHLDFVPDKRADGTPFWMSALV
ncbi:MAG: hypothetical protein WAT93_14910, partial [Pontixanthobacter sp.]